MDLLLEYLILGIKLAFNAVLTVIGVVAQFLGNQGR